MEITCHTFQCLPVKELSKVGPDPTVIPVIVTTCACQDKRAPGVEFLVKTQFVKVELQEERVFISCKTMKKMYNQCTVFKIILQQIFMYRIILSSALFHKHILLGLKNLQVKTIFALGNLNGLLISYTSFSDHQNSVKYIFLQSARNDILKTLGLNIYGGGHTAHNIYSWLSHL